MATANFSTVVSISPETSMFNFLSAVGHDKNSLKLTTKNYRAALFESEFYVELTRCLREYASSNPSYSGKAAKITFLLPDRCVLTDTFNIPGINKRNTNNLFNVACEGKYKNFHDLKINHANIAQNKQFTTIAVSVIQQALMKAVYEACSNSNMFADIVTFESNAAVNSVLSFNPKIKSDTFLLLDVKELSLRICYVSKGVTLGCYNLPFGWNILHPNKLVAENMLFEHSVGELAVLNAKEKARAKALTMSGGDAQQAENAADGGEESEGEDLTFTATDALQKRQTQIKTLPKKVPRVLPKWMLRPTPETEEGFEYENFRIILKWVLEFLGANTRLTAIAAPTSVYVNMPSQYNRLIEMTNEEEKENGIKFVTLGLDKEKEIITQNLELYGGLFAGMYNSQNNF